MGIKKSLNSVHTWLTDCLFPVRCSGCMKVGAVFCQECFGKFCETFKITKDSIPKGFDGPLQNSRLPKSFRTDTDVLFACNYSDLLAKKIVQDLKYNGVRELGTVIAELMSKFLAINGFEFHGWTVVPVPMHPAKQRQRGFNQCVIIAKRLAALLDAEFLEALTKIKRTRPQTKLNKERRLHNLDGCFSCRTPVRGKKILLIDDICTTGSTFKECASVLKKSGAAKIIVFAFAKEK